MSTSEHDETKRDTGAEGDGSKDTPLPFVPSKDDDSPVGSTDQHSSVPHHGKTPEEEAARADSQSTD